jgi:hypothetical protein
MPKKSSTSCARTSMFLQIDRITPSCRFPFIRLCGVNPYIRIPQEHIPHVQQSIAKAAAWKIFIDLDMTNSFHQIPIDNASSELLSVSTPGVSTVHSSCPKVLDQHLASYNPSALSSLTSRRGSSSSSTTSSSLLPTLLMLLPS